VAINCSALQDTLLENELFGHERGAFTGAGSRAQGKMDLAHGGTLFLDEAGDMSPALQGKILRVLQERVFYRVGGQESVSVDTRVIAASHRDLEREAAQGRFREDLYYRLNVVSIPIPPLRDRREDIPLLVTHFLTKLRDEIGKEISGVDETVMDALMRAPWPGNVREMENVLRRAAVLCRGALITMECLPESLQSGHTGIADPGDLWAPLHRALQNIFRRVTAPGESPPSTLLFDAIHQAERALILSALEHFGWNQVKASRFLGLNRGTLRKKIADYHLSLPESETRSNIDDR
jgi:DNA-binding NtrC family response regulator